MTARCQHGLRGCAQHRDTLSPSPAMPGRCPSAPPQTRSPQIVQRGEAFRDPVPKVPKSPADQTKQPAPLPFSCLTYGTTSQPTRKGQFLNPPAPPPCLYGTETHPGASSPPGTGQKNVTWLLAPKHRGTHGLEHQLQQHQEGKKEPMDRRFSRDSEGFRLLREGRINDRCR